MHISAQPVAREKYLFDRIQIYTSFKNIDKMSIFLTKTQSWRKNNHKEIFYQNLPGIYNLVSNQQENHNLHFSLQNECMQLFK